MSRGFLAEEKQAWHEKSNKHGGRSGCESSRLPLFPGNRSKKAETLLPFWAGRPPFTAVRF
jgi:hypothetical protein